VPGGRAAVSGWAEWGRYGHTGWWAAGPTGPIFEEETFLE
jgi:hypothetical protein